jgi:hypothetical protein
MSRSYYANDTIAAELRIRNPEHAAKIRIGMSTGDALKDHTMESAILSVLHSSLRLQPSRNTPHSFMATALIRSYGS